MTILRILAGILVLAGIGMIVFAEQLAVLKEGPSYTMSDLGFVVGGMLLVGIGAVAGLIAVVAGFLKRR